MDIAFTAEQQLLHDTASRLAEDLATTDSSCIAEREVLDEQWSRVAELGVPTFRSPALCGMSASGVETAIVVEQLARTLSAVPVIGQAVLVTELLEAAGAEKELELIAEGSLRIAPVLSHDLLGFGSTDAPGVAFDAAGATHALLAIDVDDKHRLIRAPIDGGGGDCGLDLTRMVRAIPESFAASASLTGDPIERERWQRVEALALTAIAADLLGVMQGALDDVVRYAGDRVQFGVKIGSFQAIQHMVADALIRVEGARSCLWHAAWATDHLPVEQARLAAMTAKAYAAAAGRDVVETTIQIFGGIAITWEHVSHLRLRRTLLDRRLFGDETVHYEAIASMRLANSQLA
jgi:alkylation response protein AidB-like acyl-CoA dehydrogenase